jgi:predicted transcriptional regulator
MPCVSPDGKPTTSGLKTLNAVKDGAKTPKEISKATGQPMYRVRSGLRELVKAEFLTETNGDYDLTDKAKQVV